MTDPSSGRLRRGLILLGGVALLMAMAVDSLAVMGRHLGIPLVGSIEIVQAMACIAACAAIVLATMSAKHASVHFVTDKLPTRFLGLARRFANAVSAAFMICMLAGSIWILLDTAPSHEQSEVLGISYIPLRVFVCLSAAATALIFLVKATVRGKK